GASQLPPGPRGAVGTARAQLVTLQPPETWTGRVLASLGRNVPAARAGASLPAIGREHLLAGNPAWLLGAHSRAESRV
ncbi:Fe(3+)-dicitrate ABC transporter substrate-binding protein FecB, partial [Klebsiella pneumoniae]|nr:Fe(3+)-dicitrate ABC transporter substrate-binding protein FecB [Klebsiella pneumoniae]